MGAKVNRMCPDRIRSGCSEFVAGEIRNSAAPYSMKTVVNRSCFFVFMLLVK